MSPPAHQTATPLNLTHLQKEIYRANGTLEEEERKQAIIDEKDKADRKEISRIKRNEYKKELATKTI